MCSRSAWLARDRARWRVIFNYSSFQHQNQPIFLENEAKYETKPEVKKGKNITKCLRFCSMSINCDNSFDFATFTIYSINSVNVVVGEIPALFLWLLNHDIFIARSKGIMYIFTRKDVNVRRHHNQIYQHDGFTFHASKYFVYIYGHFQDWP